MLRTAAESLARATDSRVVLSTKPRLPGVGFAAEYALKSAPFPAGKRGCRGENSGLINAVARGSRGTSRHLVRGRHRWWGTTGGSSQVRDVAVMVLVVDIGDQGS